MNTLLALSQKGKLLKSPLKETYLDAINSTYTASFGQKHIILGYDSQLEGFKYFSVNKLIISERYMLVDPLVDFDIFEKDDFRNENEIFSFVAPKLVAVKPYDLDLIYKQNDMVGVAYNFSTPEAYSSYLSHMITGGENSNVIVTNLNFDPVTFRLRCNIVNLVRLYVGNDLVKSYSKVPVTTTLMFVPD
jgi:hypothetical protein